jgi:hypothetical protein
MDKMILQRTQMTCSAALEKKGDIWHPRFTALEKPNGAHQPSQKRHTYNIH